MNFSKEFFEWTKKDGHGDFSIKEVSTGMLPGDKVDITCNGIGFIQMIKEMDGTLMLKMKDGKIEKFVDIKHWIID